MNVMNVRRGLSSTSERSTTPAAIWIPQSGLLQLVLLKYLTYAKRLSWGSGEKKKEKSKKCKESLP